MISDRHFDNSKENWNDWNTPQYMKFKQNKYRGFPVNFVKFLRRPFT